MRGIGIPSPFRGRWLAGRSPYQDCRHSTGSLKNPQLPSRELSVKRGRYTKMAEREGFEPTIPLRVLTLSRRAPSTTQPSLREGRTLSKRDPHGNVFPSCKRPTDLCSIKNPGELVYCEQNFPLGLKHSELNAVIFRIPLDDFGGAISWKPLKHRLSPSM
jgi:hypothetical protein